MESFVRIAEYEGQGIGGETSSDGWNVLLLNYLPRLQPDKIETMQKHIDTDECFVLLSGKAILFVADGEEKPERLQYYSMEQGRIYLVPRGIWHAPAMTPDTKILLVENSTMAEDGSPRQSLTQEQRNQIRMWGNSL